MASALRKLIRLVAAAGFWSGVANGERQDLISKPLLPRARQGYWDRLLMNPASLRIGLDPREAAGDTRFIHRDECPGHEAPEAPGASLSLFCTLLATVGHRCTGSERQQQRAELSDECGLRITQ
jgi:hypothetical protein